MPVSDLPSNDPAGAGRWARVAFAILALGAAPPGRVSLGQFGRWGVFRDSAPARCFAIAQPATGGSATLAIASWPRLRAHGQLHVRFGRPLGGAAVLEASGRRFVLATRGAEGWAASAHDDARIAVVLRGGGMLQVKAVDVRGRRFRDLYSLDGAASAIDAMRLGCLIGGP